MSADPFIGEIMLWPAPFAPVGWELCHGQLLAISSNMQLYSLITNKYGGDGVSTFALPDLRGRSMIGVGQGNGLSAYDLGAKGGEGLVHLTEAQMPLHGHDTATLAATMQASNTNASSSTPSAGVGLGIDTPAGGGRGGGGTADLVYTSAAADTELSPPAPMSGGLGPSGQSQGHENYMPFTVINYCIAVEGNFPTPNP